MKRLIRGFLVLILAFLMLSPAGVEAFGIRPSYIDVQATSVGRVFSVYVENIHESTYLLSSKVVSKTGTLNDEQIGEMFVLPEAPLVFEPGQIAQVPLKFQSIEGVSGNHELALQITAEPQGETGQVGFISVFDIPVTLGFGPVVDDFAGLTGADIQREGLNSIRVIGRVENTTQRKLTGFYAVQIERGDFEKTLGGENVVLRGASEKELQAKYSLFSLKEQLTSPKFGKITVRVSYLPTYGADYQVLTNQIFYIPWLFLAAAAVLIIFGIMGFVRLKNVKKA